MFYTYTQNNSGGGFDFDEHSGLTHHVIIEAQGPEEADFHALDMGIYFDGVNADLDCMCCGDRWYPAHGKGDEVPNIYESTPEEYVKSGYNWMAPGREVCIHYSNGTKEWH